MDARQLKQLKEKFQAGELTPLEQEQIEQLILEGRLEPDVFDDKGEFLTDFMDQPSGKLDDRFYEFLQQNEGKVMVEKALWYNHSIVRVVAATVLLLMGFFVGKYESSPEGPTDSLAYEVSQLKEMVMLSLIEKESSVDRLKAVNMSSEMPVASEKIIEALFQTLNSDPSVNVRLSAVEALAVYSDNERVRAGLIQSISLQESPMLQMELAEIMVFLQEKAAIDEFRKLMDKPEVQEEVKQKIQRSMEALI